jgi:3D (Asp-Asp-Asp) domain-containing protein
VRRLALLLLLVAPGPGLSAQELPGTFEVTFYCSCPRCCGKGARGITASGRPAAWGVVAADPKVLPLGTRVALSCYPGRVFTVLDTGSAIKGRRIDVWVPSHEWALRLGRIKGVRVEIVGDGDCAPASGASQAVASSGPRRDHRPGVPLSTRMKAVRSSLATRPAGLLQSGHPFAEMPALTADPG